jgi:cell division transport system ATP-binding protein
MLIKETDPDAGDVLFKGQSVLDIKKAEVADLRRQIGVVFQDFKLLSSKTVFENVAIALEVVNTDDQVIKNIVPNVLTMVGLSSKMFKYPHQLSGIILFWSLVVARNILVRTDQTGNIASKRITKDAFLLSSLKILIANKYVSCNNKRPKQNNAR